MFTEMVSVLYNSASRLGSAHMETILLWYCYHLVLKNLTFCLGKVPELHLQTAHQHKPTVLERKPACHKHKQRDLGTACKTGSLSVFNRRVSNISAGKEESTYRLAINWQNQQVGYTTDKLGTV